LSLLITEIVAPESNIKAVSTLFICPITSSLTPAVGTLLTFSVQLEIRSVLILFGCSSIILELGFSVKLSGGGLTSTS